MLRPARLGMGLAVARGSLWRRVRTWVLPRPRWTVSSPCVGQQARKPGRQRGPRRRVRSRAWRRARPWAAGRGLYAPDGDGLNNATEFAFGTSPSGAGNSDICEMLPAEEGKMAVGFLRRVSGAEASYQARAFTDLSAGFSSGTLLTPVRSADQTGVPPGYERVEVQAPTTGDRGFIQVQAEVP